MFTVLCGYNTMCSDTHTHRKIHANHISITHVMKHSPKCMCVLSGSERVFLRNSDFSISSFRINLPKLDWI